MIKFIKRLKDKLIKSNRSTGGRGTWLPISAGGVYVDHETALNFSAVFACVRYVAETVAGLPWRVYRRRQDGGKDIATTHTLDRLLHLRPNREMSAFAFKTLLTAWAQTWGNAYAEIEKDAAGRIAALWPISPERVDIKRDPDTGELYYEIRNGMGPKTILMPDEIFHVSGMGFDGIRGYSVISLAATSIGAGIASDQFTASFYANGAVLSGALTHPKTLTDEAHDRLKKDFKEQYSGSKKAWKPIILEEDMKWQTFGMPLKDAEFLASQKYRITDIARWFRVPPHKIADLERATFTNIEHQSIEVVQDSIIPWTLRFEQEGDYKLISSRNYNLYYTKMNLLAMLRGDHETRSKYYKAMREMGAMNTNEIRLLEDQNPIGKDGDKYLMQSQYTTLEKIGEEVKPPEIPKDDPDQKDPDDDEVKAFYAAILADVSVRTLQRENNRFKDAKKGFKINEDFDTWADSFYVEHKGYMKKAFSATIEAIAENHNYHPIKVFNLLDQFIEWRTTLNRQRLFDTYTGELKKPWNAPRRAIEMAGQLLDEIQNLKAKGQKK